MKLKRLVALTLVLLLACCDAAFAKDYYAKAKKDTVIYKKASSSSDKITTVESGSWLFVTETEDGWAKVKYNGKTGYTSSSHVKKTAKAVYVKSDSAVIYKEADSSSKKLVTLSEGTKMDAYYITGSYTNVVYGKYEGFMRTSSITLTKPSDSDKNSEKTTTTKTSTSTKKTMYVQSASVSLYRRADSSSTKQGTVVYGCKVTVTETNGSWSKCTYGSVTGYCKTSSLTSSNPNTLNNTVYVKDKSVKIYASPSTSAKTTTVSTSTALKQTAKYDRWSRVTYNGNVGFVKTSELTSKKGGDSTKDGETKKDSKKAVSADWFKSNIQSKFYKGRVVTVTDVSTKISFKVKRKGGQYHADVEPYSSSDTAAMKKACGSDFMTWHRRAIWVTIDGTKYAASMNCMAHGECNIKDNHFDGHFCIHFTNSKTHCSDKVDSAHQAAIKRALSAS